MVSVNGAMEDIEGMTLASYLEKRGCDIARVATEMNGAIVPKASYGETVLCAGDAVEIVAFVGGG